MLLLAEAAGSETGWIAILITAVTSTVAAIAMGWINRCRERDKLDNERQREFDKLDNEAKFLELKEHHHQSCAERSEKMELDLKAMKEQLSHCEEQHKSSEADRKDLWQKLNDSQKDRERLWALLTQRGQHGVS